MYTKFICVVISVTLIQIGATEKNETYKIPEYIIPCYKADPNINECLKGTFNHLRPYLTTGIDDINVPSLDPLKIEKIVIENGRGAFNVKAVFYNVTAAGGSNYSVTDIKANVNDYVIEFKFNLPRIEIKGRYDVDGNVLLLPIRSKGDFWAIFLDVDAAAKVHGKEIKDKSNERYMKADKMFVDFKLKKSRFRIRDIINNDNVIGKAMNQFLNNNADEIIAEMKPAANVAIARHFKEFINSAFLKLPLKLWLPDA